LTIAKKFTSVLPLQAYGLPKAW